MGNRREVVAQVAIDDLVSAMLRDVKEDSTYCQFCIEPRSEAVLLPWQVGFKDGTEHDQHRHLYHAVANRRDFDFTLHLLQ